MSDSDEDVFNRRENLRVLVGDKHGAQAAMAKKLGIDSSDLNQLLSGHRNIGGKRARKFEEALGLPKKSLDRTPGEKQRPATAQDIEDVLRRASWLNEENRSYILGLINALNKKGT